VLGASPDATWLDKLVLLTWTLQYALPVDISPVSDLHDDNDEHVFLDLVEDAIVALANAIDLSIFELLTSGRPWLVC